MKTKTAKITAILVTLVMIITLLGIFGLGISAASPTPATTEIDGATYYQIETVDHLVWYCNNTSYQNRYNAILMNDIDLSSVCSEEKGNWFSPTMLYLGVFDGNGKTVKNLYINAPTETKKGLFGHIYKGTIKNLTVTGTVTALEKAGGFVGYGACDIYDSVNYVNVTVTDREAGGFVGYQSSSTIDRCINYGNVTQTEGGTANIGGIAGNFYGKIYNSVNFGTISASGLLATGIAGDGYVSGTAVESCINYGSVSASGAVYEITSDAEFITDCYYRAGSSNPAVKERGYGVVTNVTSVSADALADGSIAYSLGEGWGMQIGVDTVPVPGGAKVYQNINPLSICSSPTYLYSNVKNTDKPIHDETLGVEAFENGVCKNCGYACVHTDGTLAYSNVTDTAHDATYDCCNKLISGLSHEFDASGLCPCSMQASAKVNDTYFVSLEEALNMASETVGSTLTVLVDTDEMSEISKGEFTIDLNGKKLGNAETSLKNVKLTIKGEGEVEKLAVRTGATLTVEGGTFNNITVVDGALLVKGGYINAAMINASYADSVTKILSDDYYLYDKDGVLIDTSAIFSSGVYYIVYDFTAKQGADLRNAEVTIEGGLTYNGTEHKPVVIVKISGVSVDPSHYEISYSDNVDAGEGTVTLSAKGGIYTGNTSEKFVIEKADLTLSHLDITLPGEVFDESVKEVGVSLKNLYTGVGEWTISILRDNVAVSEIFDSGAYSITVSGPMGDNFNAYSDIVIAEFTITPAEIVDSAVSFTEEEFVYNGNVQIPELTVYLNGKTLLIGTDYVLTWDKEDFVNAGTYTALIEGRGNYSGKVTRSYTITRKPLVEGSANLDIAEATYNGEAHIPTLSVTDKEKTLLLGTDYLLSWNKEGFVNADTYTVTVTGIGNYSGSITKEFVIHRAALIVEVSSPISSVLPGNIIMLSVESNSEELPTAVVSGENMTADGLKITVNDNLVIGVDTVTVTVTYPASQNYEGGSDTVTLEVGMVDFSEDISSLEEDIANLNELLENKADASEIENKLTEIGRKLVSLEENGATDIELAALKEEIVSLYTKALEDAVKALEEKVESQIDPDELAEEIKKVTDVIDALDGTYSTDTELSEAILLAKEELTAAYTKALKEAVNTLNKAIEEGDKVNSEALYEAIGDFNTLIGEIPAEYVDVATYVSEVKTSLEKALDEAVKTLEAADKTNSETLETEIGRVVAIIDALDNTYATDVKLMEAVSKAEEELKVAKEALEDLIDGVEKKLDSAKTELDTAIDTLEAAMLKGDSDLSAEIESLNTALANAKATLEKADSDSRTELIARIETADKTLDDAIKAVQKNLDEVKALLEEKDKALENKDTALMKADEDNKALLEEKDRILEEKTELLETLLIVVSVASGIALLGSATFVSWFFIDRRKKMK